MSRERERASERERERESPEREIETERQGDTGPFGDRCRCIPSATDELSSSSAPPPSRPKSPHPSHVQKK